MFDSTALGCVTSTSNDAPAWLPCESVAPQLTNVAPMGNVAPDPGEQLTATLPSTMSVAVGFV